MKKMKFYLGAFVALVAMSFQSCSDDDSYSVGDFAADWATVNVKENHVYDFTGDSWGKLWPAALTDHGYCPMNDGQRVILYFNPLYDNYPAGYDCSIKVTGIREILTKQVEELTASNEEEYGNDPAYVREGNVWISRGGYLNIVFSQNLPSKVKHRVSLVRNTTTTAPDDGYIHLEYRYNTYADTTGFWGTGAVSFDLNTLDVTDKTKGIKVKIHSATEGERELTFDLKNTSSPDASLSQMDFSGMEVR